MSQSSDQTLPATPALRNHERRSRNGGEGARLLAGRAEQGGWAVRLQMPLGARRAKEEKERREHGYSYCSGRLLEFDSELHVKLIRSPNPCTIFDIARRSPARHYRFWVVSLGYIAYYVEKGRAYGEGTVLPLISCNYRR